MSEIMGQNGPIRGLIRTNAKMELFHLLNYSHLHTFTVTIHHFSHHGTEWIKYS